MRNSQLPHNFVAPGPYNEARGYCRRGAGVPRCYDPRTTHLPNEMMTGLKQFVRNSYLFNQLSGEVSYHFSPLYKKRPLVIYQMGKVGSESVEHSLASYQLGCPIYRAHALRKEHLQRGLQAAHLTPREYFKRSRHGFRGQLLARQLARDLHKGGWRVVTMVRDPVAQNISAFFQVIDMLIPDLAVRLSRGTLTNEELMPVFLKNYPPDGVYIRWFDLEMKPSFDIDVFATPFPVAKGFEIYHEPHVDLLLLRLEDLDRCAAAAFAEFLGIDDFRITKKNDAKNKDYNDLYTRFRNEAVFPRSYVDGVYGSKYAQHFYTTAELAGFRSRLKVSD